MSGKTGRVCIVGGGPAGLSLARSLKALAIPFDAYERHSDLGGLWDSENPGTPVYRSAHFISSKTKSQFHDFPMPAEYPDFPSARQILSYIRAFAKAYDLYPHFNLGTEVKSAHLVDGAWDVTLATGEIHRYAALICATGTNWHPSLPQYPGTFTGEMRHSASYDGMEEFAGKRVLVIGGGNSGCDIACDAAQAADSAFISLRRGYHFIPKRIFGMPADVFGSSGPQLPMRLEQAIFGVMLRLLTGDLTKLGLPKPDHRLFESHPILNDQLLHHLAHGNIKAKPDVERFDGRAVLFKDGTREEIDLVLCATGYDWKIPYVDPGLFQWSGTRPNLFLNIFNRETPSLYALGFIETNGGLYGLLDETADIVARAILARGAGGREAQALDRLVAASSGDLSGGINFIKSARHQNYVDIHAYQKALKRLRRRLGWPDLTLDRFTSLRAAPRQKHAKLRAPEER
ncbi:MAG: NAD(P)-binding domain-containing protein [Dongiaceae bacterium]